MVADLGRIREALVRRVEGVIRSVHQLGSDLFLVHASLTSRWMEIKEPCIAYIANAITYLLFVVLSIVDVSFKSNTDTQATPPSVLDWIVFVFVVALVLQLVSQTLGRQSDSKNCITNCSNLFDIFLMLTFVSHYYLSATTLLMIVSK